MCVCVCVCVHARVRACMCTNLPRIVVGNVATPPCPNSARTINEHERHYGHVPVRFDREACRGRRGEGRGGEVSLS